MGAESIAQVHDKPVAQARKPDKVEALDVVLMEVPMKEIPDFTSIIDSPDSVLNASLKENSGRVSNESVTVNNVLGIDNLHPGLPDSSKTEVDIDASFEGKIQGSDVNDNAASAPAGIKEKIGEQESVTSKVEALESSESIVQSSTAEASIAREIQEMEEISLEEDSERKGAIKKAALASKLRPVMNVSKMVESFNRKSIPGMDNTSKSVSHSSSSGFDSAEPEVLNEESQSLLTKGEGHMTKITTEARGDISQPEFSGAELKIKTEAGKAVHRTDHAEPAATATGSFPASKTGKDSEIQDAGESSTPPTPERNGTVIRLTRQMSRVSTGMGPMSPRFEIRAAKEVQDLQEKVKSMEEDLRRKSAVIETLSFNHKERENEMLKKMECLELANEQLLQGGNDSSIQLQMELTRLQRQNSVLQLRERELQFQINTQDMIKAQIGDKRSATEEPTDLVEQLESKVAVLESKLAEAVEVSNMYKVQLHEAFSQQKSAQSAALLNLGDAGEGLRELQKLRKQTKDQETELVDLQDRYFMISVRLAETAAQKEELLSKLKRIQGLR